MSNLFISHSSVDDSVVRELQHALGDLKEDVWIDSRELRVCTGVALILRPQCTVRLGNSTTFSGISTVRW